MKLLINIALLLTLTISVIGCTDSYSDEPAAGDTEMVNFTISVYAGDPEAKGSRVGALPGDDYFGEPMTQYERMRTLRVIIVRPDGTVERNEFLSRTIPDEGLGQYNDIRMKVLGGETKKVYLFANEASMIDFTTRQPLFDFNTLPAGSKFPADAITGLLLTTQAGQPLIDNTGSEKLYVPMTEQFDIDIKAPQPDGTDLYQSADLFITRAAVKFSFHIHSSTEVPEDLTIESLSIEALSNKEYLFPTGAEYAPAKYPVNFVDRYIKAYTVPSGAVNEIYTFHPGITFTPATPVGTVIDYQPPVYFAETALADGAKYRIRMTYAGKGGTSTAELPNLPSLPRNTHVKVNITIGQGSVEFQIDVVPYTAVPLNPTFGFDELLPRPPVIGDMPPWVVIPDPDSPGGNVKPNP